jgi:hypothetical protein
MRQRNIDGHPRDRPVGCGDLCRAAAAASTGLASTGLASTGLAWLRPASLRPASLGLAGLSGCLLAGRLGHRPAAASSASVRSVRSQEKSAS